MSNKATGRTKKAIMGNGNGMGKLIKAIAGILFATTSIFAASSAAWSAYPERPIRLIVSFPPGGSSDAMARIVQPFVEEKLGQTIIIENRPGAGGMIAIEYVAKSAPDGYIIGLGGAGALGTNLGLQAMPYDPAKDIVAITGLASSPFILAASNKFKGNTLQDVITGAKSGQAFSIGHGGNGTLMHLTAEMLLQDANIKAALVSYRGIAPVVNDLMGDHVELGIVDPPSAKAALDGSAIKAIAVTSKSRFPVMPNTPTFAESGLPGFESTGWFGIVAPHGIPIDVVAKLNAAFVAALNDPDTVNRIRTLGSDPMPMTPTEFSAFIDKEIAKWGKVVQHATQKPE
jgi:tripartite-type tricarboxylate transporter receptor subunit TctC